MNPKSYFALIGFTIIFALGTFPVSAEGIPKLINYQGKLTDATGAAMPGGDYSVRFELFDAAEGGTLVWGEVRTVSLVSGVFSIALGGAEAALNEAPVKDLRFAFGDAERYLETTIVSGPGIVDEKELQPRQRMASVPFAVSAKDAALAEDSNHLGGKPASFWTPPGGMMAFGGSTDPDGWLICDGRELGRSEYPALFAAIGTAFGNGDGVSTFNLPNTKGLVLRGTGTGTINGRSKVGPSLGGFQEDQLQRITASTTRTLMSINGTNSGAFSGTVQDAQIISKGGSFRRESLNFDSNRSPGARVSSATDGETRVSSLGVNYIIKY